MDWMVCLMKEAFSGASEHGSVWDIWPICPDSYLETVYSNWETDSIKLGLTHPPMCDVMTKLLLAILL